MPVEAATYLSDLVPANPTHTDPFGAADQHIRLIKSTLQTTLPNVKGAVTASHTDLNTIPGLAARVTTLETTTLAQTGGTVTGSITVTGAVTANQGIGTGVGYRVYEQGNPLIPYGVIVMWAGAANAIPLGWALCNGTNGTPDLRDRFIVGAGGGYTVGQTGGATTQTVGTATAGLHSHAGLTGIAGIHQHTAFTDTAGAHSHGGQTGDHALTVQEIPPHSHPVQYALTYTGQPGSIAGGFNQGGGNYTESSDNTGGGGGHNHQISSDGGHQHNVSVAWAGDHAHSIQSDGLHAHDVTLDGRPPYYALCFIMHL